MRLPCSCRTPSEQNTPRKTTQTYGDLRLLDYDRTAAPATRRIRIHPGKHGRPSLARRVKVSALTWEEARRHRIGLNGITRKFYALQDGAAYKVARYFLTRAATLGQTEINERLSFVEHYAHLSREHIATALPKLGEIGISAAIDRGRVIASLPANALQLPRLRQQRMEPKALIS